MREKRMWTEHVGCQVSRWISESKDCTMTIPLNGLHNTRAKTTGSALFDRQLRISKKIRNFAGFMGFAGSRK